jgi:type II secretory pathway predicted ATPase ExeA
MTDDFLKFFGFKSMPFGKDSAELYTYEQLAELKQILELTVSQKTIGLLTGQAGVGKTTAAWSVVGALPANTYNVVYLGHDQQGVNLMRRFCLALGLNPKGHRGQQLLQVSQYLSENLLENGRSVSLIVDECHLLDLPTLEDLRMLTNADFDRSSPLSIILIGQLAFRRQLRSPGYEAINQRIRFRYALEGLSQEETAAYVKHRLKLEGGSEDLFTADALRLMFTASGGITRELNNLCSAALLRAMAASVKKIDAKLVKQILEQKELN